MSVLCALYSTAGAGILTLSINVRIIWRNQVVGLDLAPLMKTGPMLQPGSRSVLSKRWKSLGADSFFQKTV